MAKLLLSLVVLSALLVGTYSKCGDGAWHTAIKTQFDTIVFTDSNQIVSGDSDIRTKYNELLERNPVAITAGLVPEYCASFFPVSADQKTCCNADSKRIINGYIRNIVKQGVSIKKKDKCKSTGEKIGKHVEKCMNDWMKVQFADLIKQMNETMAAMASAMAANQTSTTTGTKPAGQTQMSMSMGSGNAFGSQKKNEKMEKLEKQVKAQEEQMKATGLKAIAGVVGASVKLIRGSLCVICMDNAAPLDDLWDKAASVPKINQASIDAVKQAIVDALKLANENAKDCVAFIQGQVESVLAITGSKCAAAEALLSGLETKLQACTGDACTAPPVKEVFNVNGVDELTETETAGARRVLASTYTATSSGGATSQADPAEDGKIEVAPGNSITTTQTNYETSKTTATQEGAVKWDEYNAEAKAEADAMAGSSNMIGALFMILVAFFLL